MEIFLDNIENAKTLPRQMGLNFLWDIDSAFAIKHLEHIYQKFNKTFRSAIEALQIFLHKIVNLDVSGRYTQYIFYMKFRISIGTVAERLKRQTRRAYYTSIGI